MTAHEWSPPYTTWTYLGLGLALLALLLLARQWARSPSARSWPLLLLRAGVLALLLGILLNLVRVAGDVVIQDVVAPRDAPPGTRLPVRVVVRSHGYPGQRAEVRIRALADPSRPPLATLPVTLADGQQAHDLLIDHDASAGQLVAE